MLALRLLALRPVAEVIAFPNATVAFCARHLEPFRKEWPRGYAVLLARLLYVVTSDDRFYADMPKDRNGLAEVDAISGRLVKHSPLCCFLGDDIFGALTRDALDGTPRS